MLLDELVQNPGVGVLVVLIGLVVAGRALYLSRIRIVQAPARHEMDDTEPSPLRRLTLDATARYAPKAQDRRRVS